MDGPQFTPQQRAAVAQRATSVALSAGAGCGKTFVLTERFLSYLEPGSKIGLSDLVAITFTERAAREMRDRIRRRCQDRLAAAATDAEADHWLAISRELESARVSTIHAFCASLLRAHAVEAGLDPRFRVLDQAQAETLLAETIDDALRELLAQHDETVIELIVRFGLLELKKMLRSLLGQRDKIDFAAWSTRSADDVLELWAGFHADVLRPEALRDLAEGETSSRLLSLLAAHVPDHDVMQARRTYLLERLPTIAHGANPAADLAELKEHARVQGGGSGRAWPSPEVYEQVKKLLGDLRGQIDRTGHLLQFDREPARGAAQAGLQLLAVTRSVVESYAARKRGLSALDFDDLLIGARDLLADGRHENVRRHLGQQIRALLVDEFQDTDPLQVDLVKSLCGEGLAAGKLFFVGDYKQSIYRFRRADPRVFRQLQEELPPQGRLPLTLNFRSQPQILEFVNALFCDELGPGYEPLAAYRAQISQPPNVEFLWVPAEDDQEDTASLRRREATWIARRLRGMLDGDTLSRGTGFQPVRQQAVPLDAPRHARRDSKPHGRDAPATTQNTVATAQDAHVTQPGDIAILFRALSDVQFYEEALRQHGIDYYLVGGHAFYAQQEIFDLLNLLRAIAYPSDLISLVGVLRSPFFALADETLYWLAKHSGGIGTGLFAAPPAHVADDQRRRVELAAATLRKLRSDKDRLPIAQLMNEALSVTGYDAVLLAEFLGERKLANLRKLIDQARSFDRSGMFTLGDFITQLSDFVAKQPDEPLAATMAEGAGVVRLMTIHQAKGLEFPVVVVPDLRRPTHGGLAPATFHPRLGPVVRSPDEERKHRAATGFDFLQRIEASEDRAELMRLFYVATTRAADYLILSSGGVSELGEASSPWLQLLAKRFDLHTGRCLAALPPGYETPQVRVTGSQPPLTKRHEQSRRPDLETAIAQAAELAAMSGPTQLEAMRPKSIEPIPVDGAARREFSFSRLNGTLHGTSVSADDDELTDDLSEAAAAPRPSIDPIGLGTLVHAVLEELPFDKQAAPAINIDDLVAQRAEEHVAGDPHAMAEATDLIRRFTASSMAGELAAAREVHRELEFVLAWPPDRPTAGGVYLRGYIDCLFRDDSGWRLLDYKTNQVARAGVQAVAAGYEMQMLVYALAAEAALGQPPREMILYFLRPGVAYPLKLDAAARQRAVSLVNEAIAQYLGRGARPNDQQPPRVPPPPSDGPRRGPHRPPSQQRRKHQGLLPGFSDRAD